MARPTIFIASSVESLNVAYSIQDALQYKLDPVVWDQGIFLPSRSTIENILRDVSTFDYAVFVFTPKDILTMRETTTRVVRDNVLFEFGIFLGVLGRDRTFIIVPEGTSDPSDELPIHLPTDLIGFEPLKYKADRGDKNLKAALGPSCFKITQIADELGHRAKNVTRVETSRHVPHIVELEVRQAAVAFKEEVNFLMAELKLSFRTTDTDYTIIPVRDLVMEIEAPGQLARTKINNLELQNNSSNVMEFRGFVDAWLVSHYSAITPEIRESLENLEGILDIHLTIQPTNKPKIQVSVLAHPVRSAETDLVERWMKNPELSGMV